MAVKLLGIDLFRVDSTPIHEPGIIVSDVKGGQGSDAGNINPQQPYPTTGNPGGPTAQSVFPFPLTFSPDAEFRYVQAGSAIAVGDAVRIDFTVANEPYVVVPVSATDQMVDGIALPTVSGTVGVSIPANSYGWIQVRGRVPSNGAQTVAAARWGAKMAAAGTAGDTKGSSTSGNLATLSSADATDATAMGRRIQQLDAAVDDGSTTQFRGEVYIY